MEPIEPPVPELLTHRYREIIKLLNLWSFVIYIATMQELSLQKLGSWSDYKESMNNYTSERKINPQPILHISLLKGFGGKASTQLM